MKNKTEFYANDKLQCHVELFLDDAEAELEYSIDQLTDEQTFIDEEQYLYDNLCGDYPPHFDKSLEEEFLDQFTEMLFWEDVLKTLKGEK